jgi:hypothetical protein
VNLKSLIVSAVITAAVGLTDIAFAASDDYVFEPVKTELTRGDDVTVAVRLVHKPTGKPVPDAVIIRSRMDMTPDGMADMASSLTPLPATELGVYAFKAELTAGRWLLSLAAKVQGEPETVVGKVTFKVSK